MPVKTGATVINRRYNSEHQNAKTHLSGCRRGRAWVELSRNYGSVGARPSTTQIIQRQNQQGRRRELPAVSAQGLWRAEVQTLAADSFSAWRRRTRDKYLEGGSPRPTEDRERQT